MLKRYIITCLALCTHRCALGTPGFPILRDEYIILLLVPHIHTLALTVIRYPPHADLDETNAMEKSDKQKHMVRPIPMGFHPLFE